MLRSEYYFVLKEKYHDINVFSEIERTCRKIEEHIGSSERPCISVSGGSDSDCIVHLICTYFSEYLYKCRFVFVNTGLEYDATKRHLLDLEKRYGITIDRIRGLSVVTACRRYGFPILNKVKAHYIDMYRRRTPKGYYLVFEANEERMHFRFTEAERNLARYLDKNDINVSSKCCDVSKKEPLKKYHKEYNIDLTITGERKAEGGTRAISHKSCFEDAMEGKKIAKFMPLFWWSDSVKQIFKDSEKIRYSDCYEVWGLKRTGCVGCPFGKYTATELEKMYCFEPKLFQACMSVFGLAYELTDTFHCRKRKCLPEFYQNTLCLEYEKE